MTGQANFYQRILQALPDDRNKTCLTTELGRAVSYSELVATTGRLATRLGQLGVRPGDRVAVQVEKSPEALFLYLACLQIGAIYLPLNTAYTGPELAYFFADARPGLIVGTTKMAPAILEIAQGLGNALVRTLDQDGSGSLMDGLASLEITLSVLETSPDDVAAMLYTSGTTGRSKGAMLTHLGLISNAEVLTQEWGFTAKDILLHTLPIFHVHGLFVACGCAFLSGARMLFHASFDAEKALDHFAQATVFMGVPTYYSRLLASPRLNASAAANMRLFVSGSAPLLPETFHHFRERTGHTILERYGMTETGMNTSNPLRGERRVGTVGQPLPGIALRIADDTGKSLKPGEVGVIEVKGPNLLKGYWQNPEKTTEAFRQDGYFITGDVAYEDPDGYICIVGRASDMIISGGYNVYPKEIETIIDEQPGVTESAVIGIPHPDFGEAVIAIIRPQNPANPPDSALILATLKKTLAGFKIPKKMIFVDDLPRNTMGKVIKAELRKAYAQLLEK